MSRSRIPFGGHEVDATAMRRRRPLRRAFEAVIGTKEGRMRDHDDVPYIVIERESGGGTGAFLLGALVGAGLALLLAPQSGEETQKEIRDRARQLRDSAEDRVRDAQRQLESRLDQAREGVQVRVGQVKEAVESGRQAAREARTDIERKLEQSKAAYRAGVDAARDAAHETGDAQPDEAEASD
jgi:gas vesicle protein